MNPKQLKAYMGSLKEKFDPALFRFWAVKLAPGEVHADKLNGHWYANPGSKPTTIVVVKRKGVSK